MISYNCFLSVASINKLNKGYNDGGIFLPQSIKIILPKVNQN